MKITQLYILFFLFFCNTQIVLSMEWTPEEIRTASAGQPLHRTHAIYPASNIPACLEPNLLNSSSHAGKSLAEVGRTTAIHSAPTLTKSNALPRTDVDTIDRRLVDDTVADQDDLEVTSIMSPVSSPKRTTVNLNRLSRLSIYQTAQAIAQQKANEKDGYKKLN